jgi:hypothetical protein
MNIPTSTINWHLVEKTGTKIFLLLWVLHTVTGELRQKRVELAPQLLGLLKGKQRGCFLDIVTGDKVWFLPDDHRQIWFASVDEGRQHWSIQWPPKNHARGVLEDQRRYPHQLTPTPGKIQ